MLPLKYLMYYVVESIPFIATLFPLPTELGSQTCPTPNPLLQWAIACAVQLKASGVSASLKAQSWGAVSCITTYNSFGIFLPLGYGLSSHFQRQALSKFSLLGAAEGDPRIEPLLMVINSVLLVMGYDYPREKMSIYLSDDEPWSPEACFKTRASPPIEIDDPLLSQEWSSIKLGKFDHHLLKTSSFMLSKLYEDMKDRIKTATKLGQIPQKDAFLDWGLSCSKCDHQTILQPLPTLEYLACEKRPQYHHNFKAGALNTLVSF
ncbi:hypothetical protein RJ641_018640, partial [Dillenia turbinata]